MATEVPLCVDLDGVLLETDSFWEGIVDLLKKNPLMIFPLLVWLWKGKAVAKSNVSARFDRNAEDWPYRSKVLDWLRAEKARGRTLLLVTGAPERTANGVFRHLKLFDDVHSSSDTVNLTSTKKRDLLIEKYGRGGFDYVGDSGADIPVFEAARESYLVMPTRSVRRWHRTNPHVAVLEPKPNQFKTLVKAMRVHQWLKNILIAVPMILSHEYFDARMIYQVVVGFLSFSFAASAVYLFNDLVDLDNDRRHPSKHLRPLARGDVTIPTAVAVAFSLLAASFVLSFLLNGLFFLTLLLYLATTFTYSLFLKRKLLVDVFTLAGLFTLRIVAGVAATSTQLSFWLLAFSMFFFFSLALLKRYVELQGIDDDEGSKKLGRGYYAVDLDMVGQAGLASAFSAATVLALYIHSNEVNEMYRLPWLLWPLCPMILYMLLRIWMLARRQQMHDDPVVFLIRDWRSQIVTVTGALLMLIAATFPT